jgi:hypothetical protein
VPKKSEMILFRFGALAVVAVEASLVVFAPVGCRFSVIIVHYVPVEELVLKKVRNDELARGNAASAAGIGGKGICLNRVLTGRESPIYPFVAATKTATARNSPCSFDETSSLTSDKVAPSLHL